MNLEDIPTLEIPGLERLEQALAKLDAYDARLTQLEDTIGDLNEKFRQYHKSTGTLLSGLLPGGVIHDRVAEARAAVKALLADPENPSSSAIQAAVALNWGQMSTED